ncbi:MAG: LCP family protein, partial [Actinobacteria bacterium]|nr:LCP family protein [Actinomycetota bacterium]
MSYDNRDDNDDNYESGEGGYPDSDDDSSEDKDGFLIDDDYSRPETGKRGRFEKRNNKDPDDDFFKDEDFEFADYSGDDQEDEGYRSRRIREKRKRRKFIYTSFAVLMILIVIAAAIVFGYRYIKNRFFTTAEITEEERINVPESLELGQDINIIIACAGEDLNEPDVSSIVFTSYYSASGETRSLCMPTKTLMDVPGIGAELIGRAVEIGGMDLLSLTLEKGLGMDIEIDYYLLMDVQSIVDKLGGIELTLDQAYAIKDYTEGTTFSLEPGVNLLNGSETQNMLKYFSGIEENIPIEDIKIQKKIIDTIIAGIVGSDDEQLTNNINLVKDYIDSDLSL